MFLCLNFGQLLGLIPQYLSQSATFYDVYKLQLSIVLGILQKYIWLVFCNMQCSVGQNFRTWFLYALECAILSQNLWCYSVVSLWWHTASCLRYWESKRNHLEKGLFHHQVMKVAMWIFLALNVVCCDWTYYLLCTLMVYGERNVWMRF